MPNTTQKATRQKSKTNVNGSDTGACSCLDCGAPFLFGEEERKFYSERGFKAPDRCLDCREKLRAERNADLIRSHEANATSKHWVEALGHYGGGQNGQRNDNSRKPATYPAVCAACGKETAVPFIPRTGKPVYCASCYGSRRARS